MHITILTPFLAARRGNAITARRLAAGLTGQGIRAEIFGFRDQPLPPAAFASELVHGFHAYHFGSSVLSRLPERVPLVLTLTGTDYNIDLYRPDRRQVVTAALDRAELVTAFHPEAASQITTAVPAVAGKITVVPPGVTLPDSGQVAAPPGVTPADKIILIVAGLRQVKNVTAAINAVAALGRDNIKLLHVGPALEAEATAEVQQAVSRYPWFISLGEVAHEEMAALYRRAAVVVNTSQSEAIPGSILEAMYLGRPVVVADIPGNRAAVRHEHTGLIYKDQIDLVRALATIIDDQAFAAALGNRAAGEVREQFAPEAETATFCRLYQAVLRKRGRNGS
jgi:glycosyltransferase involved in cell wall biosynthesis